MAHVGAQQELVAVRLIGFGKIKNYNNSTSHLLDIKIVIFYLRKFLVAGAVRRSHCSYTTLWLLNFSACEKLVANHEVRFSLLIQSYMLFDMKTFAFVDASNLFYGGEKSLGWKIDYKKLLAYLNEKYDLNKVLYFGGVEIHDFPYDYQKEEAVPIQKLEKHLSNLLTDKGAQLDEAHILLMGRHLQRVRFYLKLEKFGYQLFLKPVKLYEQDDGTTKRKANCDVDMAFHLMKEKDNFNRVIVLSGDGDFLPVLKYLRENDKDVVILGRAKRTAKEIRQFAGSNFRDFEYLKYRLKME